MWRFQTNHEIIKSTRFRVVMLCRLVGVYWHFGRTYCLHLQCQTNVGEGGHSFLQNNGGHPPNYMALQFRRLYSSQSCLQKPQIQHEILLLFLLVNVKERKSSRLWQCDIDWIGSKQAPMFPFWIWLWTFMFQIGKILHQPNTLHMLKEINVLWI
jgi:hypothetical protein